MKLEWQKIGEAKRPDCEATGDGGARYVIRKAGDGRNASHILRMNGIMVEHFLTNASARIRAQAMEDKKQAKAGKEPELLLDTVAHTTHILERALIRAAVQNDPLLTNEVKQAMGVFFQRYEIQRKQEYESP